MHKLKPLIIDLTLVFIITIPAFIRLLNPQYFSMHDDQHIVRLFLLDQGVRQGYIYPRWVDGLGFGFGYPLFNFYPPLIYYIAEVFHLLGFSLIWSVKLTIILGFYLGAIGVYLLVKKFTDRLSAYLSVTLYTFFFYHSVLVYVRGALAEFFSLALLPFVFLCLDNLFGKTNWKNAVLFGIGFGLLILTQPLIALPSLIFIGFLFIFYLSRSKNWLKFVYMFNAGFILALSLTAFFWLPSIMERKFTLTDKILTGELASYKLHYINLQQFIYSPWGYGGSGAGLADGMTFQLGKIHIGSVLLSLILFCFNIIKKKKFDNSTSYYLLTTFLLLFSLFMTTEYSSFIWDRVKYLWYLQFPWRFLTFTTIFMSILGGYSFFLINKLSERSNPLQEWVRLIRGSVFIFFIISFISTIAIYQKYFRPQRFIMTSDQERTSFEEISWRISRTSYEFVPKGVKTTKTELSTTILDINKNDLPRNSYQLLEGKGTVKEVKNKFAEKIYQVNAFTPLRFRLNTYYFPGWKAYLNNKPIVINDNNDLKLSTVNVPSGNYVLKFVFENTAVRKIANLISLFSLIFILLLISKQFKKID